MDGLPQSPSDEILQDRRGFIWIGTKNGLSQFDGVEFKNYYKKDGLPSNVIKQLIEDSDATIWVLCPSGLSEFKGNRFKYYSPGENVDQWRFENAVYVEKENGFILLNFYPKSSIHRLYYFKNGIYSDYGRQFPVLDTIDFFDIFYDNRGSELLILNRSGQAFRWKDKKLTTLSKDRFDAINLELGKIIFSKGEKKYEYYNGELIPKEVDAKNLTTATIGNLYLADQSDIGSRLSNPKLKLPFTTFSGKIIDDQGISWFTTEKNLYRLISKAFITISKEDGLSKEIWAIMADNNDHLWFGSFFGDLQEYDGEKFILRNEYKKIFKNKVSFYRGSRKMSNGDIWFSTDQGVLIWNGVSFSKLDGINENTQICYIYEDPDNKSVFIGTHIGLYYLKNKIMKFFPEFKDSEDGVIEGVIKDREGIYWLSGHNGLYIFDGTNFKKIRDKVLPSAFTFTMEMDARGGIWITSDEGLFYYSNITKTFRHGLPEKKNQTANSLLMIDSTHLIVGRVADICMIDLKKFYDNDPNYYRFYDKTDGFTGEDCLDNGIVKDKDGKIWILTSDNVVKFDPAMIKPDNIPPRIFITGFDYQNDSLKWIHISDTGHYFGESGRINLKMYQNTIKISYTGISTPNPDKVFYSHYMEGFENKWSLPTRERSVIYEKLPPGHYIFKLVASNADGIKTPEPVIMEFTVIPRLWETVLFKILAVLIVIAATVAVTRYIIKRLQMKRAENERLKNELSHFQISSAIRPIDPHFIFNVLSSVGSLVMKGEKETAYEFILKFSNLLRIVLNNDSRVVKSLEAEIDFVKKYLELQKLRFKERLNYSIDIEGKINLQQNIPVMTIQTFVENSIKHGIENKKEGGFVSIRLIKTNEGTEIAIKDNGIGLEAARNIDTDRNGKGLRTITRLFKIFNERNKFRAEVTITDLKVKDSKLTGTEARIFIPDGYSFESSKTVE